MYPESVACGQMSPMLGQTAPCDGVAIRYENPPLIVSNDKGPWYGCPHCHRIAQYADFRPEKKRSLAKR